jgi:hypothetical protein
MQSYAAVCVACGAEIPERLYEYGDPGCIMCQSCHLGLINDADLLAEAFYFYERIYDEGGKEIGRKKCLTVAGAACLELGKAGDVLLVHMYGRQVEQPCHVNEGGN